MPVPRSAQTGPRKTASDQPCQSSRPATTLQWEPLPNNNSSHIILRRTSQPANKASSNESSRSVPGAGCAAANGREDPEAPNVDGDTESNEDDCVPCHAFRIPAAARQDPPWRIDGACARHEDREEEVAERKAHPTSLF
jgi:hypothetical protein